MSALETDALEKMAEQAVAAAQTAYLDYQADFQRITRLARRRFEERDWPSAHQDAVQRLDLYKQSIDRITGQVKAILGAHSQDSTLWARMRSLYSEGFVSNRLDFELAETFFNSITRRIFTTVGVDAKIEFVDSDFSLPPVAAELTVFQTYPFQSETAALNRVIRQILREHGFEICPEEACCEEIARRLQAHLPGGAGQIEMLAPVFFRGQGAFLVGRIPLAEGSPAQYLPCVLCLHNGPQGVYIDALLLDENLVSIVFSFTRSYFHVETHAPHALVAFLKSIMPRKRIAELYISIGYNKHGKTELYRDLIHHLDRTSDPFKVARGEKGMVMLVFTLESYDMVFKVIKDRVDPPKATTRQEVMERYDLVFRHDRAGRLVDAQEFEHLRFERSRFSPELLTELVRVAPRTVSVEDDCVVIRHLYVERRLAPLNLYVKEASPEAAAQAVHDYGQAIKDLAATNIFPGDVLLKNFGVTRHGRVVFYDYDELCLVTDVKFRRIPQALTYDDEMEAEPWFYVGPLDVFPEEFRTFLGLQEPLRGLFTAQHGDLFTVEFWKGMQARHKAGEIMDISPYPSGARLGAQ